jgi:hypothetical protein
LRAASACVESTATVQRENQPSFENSGRRPAGVKIAAGLDAERGATRTIDPVVATTTHHRITFLDVPKRLSWR